METLHADANDVDVAELVSRLTLEEKISLLGAADWWRTPAIRRDGVFVPHIKMTDGPNGARGESYVSGIQAACFPCGTCLGATFDTALLGAVGAAVAREARTAKAAHVLLGPTLNLIRSPLGGRNYETYSEDPLVLGALAAAYVRGCQGDQLFDISGGDTTTTISTKSGGGSSGKRTFRVAATPKHFVANDAEDRRRTLSVLVDERALRELYLRPFQLVRRLANPRCYMTSYNRVNGEHVSDSARLVRDVLRAEWDFEDGLVVSDWMGTYSLGPGIAAGVDVEMPGPPKWRTPEAVRDAVLRTGEVSVADIDASARRVVALAKWLGRFEDPEEPPERCVEDAGRDALIRDAAAEGMVLLKNANTKAGVPVLPVPAGASVAMIGQHALDLVQGGGGSARVDALHSVSPATGMRNLGFAVREAGGVPVFGAVPPAAQELLFETGRTEPTATPVRVEWFNGDVVGRGLAHVEMRAQPEYMIKEKWPDFLDPDRSCTRMTFDLVAPADGHHLLSVICTGRASCFIDDVLVFERPQETKLKPESFYMFKRHLERRFTHPMRAGRRYTIRLESWATNPDILRGPPLFGKMFQGSAVRFHEQVDEAGGVAEAAAVARASDYAVVCVGNTSEIESEAYDRDTMDLTAAQYDLVAAVVASNPNTVVVNFSGAPVGLLPFVDAAPALVQAWFPGQEGGDALAHVLAGRQNPSGRLPFSWPARVEDNPSWGNFPAGEDDVLRYAEGLDVGYRWYDRPENPEPLFPFGFGLSYTTFAVTAATVGQVESMGGPDDVVTVALEVANTGQCRGKVVVQLYVQAPAGDDPRRPLKELAGFAKVDVGPGESGRASVELDKYNVSFYDAERARWQANKGVYKVLVGFSSVDIVRELEFSVSTSFSWTGI